MEANSGELDRAQTGLDLEVPLPSVFLPMTVPYRSSFSIFPLKVWVSALLCLGDLILTCSQNSVLDPRMGSWQPALPLPDSLSRLPDPVTSGWQLESVFTPQKLRNATNQSVFPRELVSHLQAHHCIVVHIIWPWLCVLDTQTQHFNNNWPMIILPKHTPPGCPHLVNGIVTHPISEATGVHKAF